MEVSGIGPVLAEKIYSGIQNLKNRTINLYQPPKDIEVGDAKTNPCLSFIFPWFLPKQR